MLKVSSAVCRRKSSCATSVTGFVDSRRRCCPFGTTESPSYRLRACFRFFQGFHLHCLDPPLHTVPRGAWMCGSCILAKGADYGFEEGNEHTLADFHERASAFRRSWLTRHPPSLQGERSLEDARQEVDWRKEVDIEDHVEREFWRLVMSTTDGEDVEVEYGADVHTSKMGRQVFGLSFALRTPLHCIRLND